jgi:hypothetical protein
MSDVEIRDIFPATAVEACSSHTFTHISTHANPFNLKPCNLAATELEG